MENGKMADAMGELAEGVARPFTTLVMNGLPVDVAAHLTGRMIEKVLLNSGQQHGGD